MHLGMIQDLIVKFIDLDLFCFYKIKVTMSSGHSITFQYSMDDYAFLKVILALNLVILLTTLVNGF